MCPDTRKYKGRENIAKERKRVKDELFFPETAADSDHLKSFQLCQRALPEERIRGAESLSECWG